MINLHGRPNAIRCDNGPELTSQTFTDLCKAKDIALHFIQPGKPGSEKFQRTQGAYRIVRPCDQKWSRNLGLAYK